MILLSQKKRIKMKKKRKVKYKRKEVYRKREIFFRILREIKREIHGEKCSEKNLINKALILYYSGIVWFLLKSPMVDYYKPII